MPTVIISDISPTVTKEWKRFFEAELYFPNLHYAALNNCDLPFIDDSIDVISSGSGFGNTEGDKFKTVSEIYRVLKPGGLYVSGEGYVTQETLKSFSLDVQKILLEKRTDIFEDFMILPLPLNLKQLTHKYVVAGQPKMMKAQLPI